ncbi:MAG TPA: hypothetical protein VFC34_01485, partial [Puia sp.]|nr:hypothetical protein [Puia sp.]
MKKTTYILSFISFGIILSISSCSKKILDYNDPNNINTASYFNTPDQIQEGATGIYSAFFYDHLMGWRWEEMFDALGNEFSGRPAALSNEADIVAFWHYQFNNNNDVITGYWQFLYR